MINTTLSLSLTAFKLQLVEALQDVAKLTTGIADLNKNPSEKPSNTGNWNYCWTHGYSSRHSNRDYEKPRTSLELNIRKNCKHNSNPHLSSQQSSHRWLWLHQPFSRTYQSIHQQFLHIRWYSSWSTKQIINLCIPHRPLNFSLAIFRRQSIKRIPCLRQRKPDLHWPALQPRFLCTLHRQGCQFNRP